MSKLEDLKVGDRVAAYSGGVRHVGTISRLDSKTMFVDCYGIKILVHPKQVRKLRKKKTEFYWVRKCYSFTFNGTLPITANHDYVSTCTVDPICGSCKIFKVKRVKE